MDMTLTAEEILIHVRALPERERLRLVERVVHEVVEQTPAPPRADFSDAIWADVSDEEFGAFEAALRDARALPIRSTE